MTSSSGCSRATCSWRMSSTSWARCSTFVSSLGKTASFPLPNSIKAGTICTACLYGVRQGPESSTNHTCLHFAGDQSGLYPKSHRVPRLTGIKICTRTGCMPSTRLAAAGPAIRNRLNSSLRDDHIAFTMVVSQTCRRTACMPSTPRRGCWSSVTRRAPASSPPASTASRRGAGGVFPPSQWIHAREIASEQQSRAAAKSVLGHHHARRA